MDGMDPRSASYLQRFHPVHETVLNNVLAHSVGLFNRRYKIRKLQRCGQNAVLPGREKYQDMFVLSVPICEDQVLEWQVILNEFKPSLRPDFKVFNLGFAQFLSNNMLRTGLFHYDINNENAILNVVNRLREMYIEYVLTHLKSPSSLHEHISSTLQVLNCSHELVLLHNIVHFSLRLPLLFSRLQLDLPPSKLTVTLTLSAPYHHGSDLDYQSRVHMSDDLSEQIGGDRIKYPQYGRDKPMLKYIYDVIGRIQDHIDSLAAQQLKQKRFIFSLLTIAGVSVLEWDAIHFQSISFLFNTEQFYWTVFLEITTSNGIVARLRSIYNGEETWIPLGSVPAESDGIFAHRLLSHLAAVGMRQSRIFSINGIPQQILELEQFIKYLGQYPENAPF
uniref:BRISC and BRCA1-A complex member 2 n=1 Tax=Cacopsylla melanoneura TaxID=428564 RepID=A0A8D9EZV6_9HEMI